MSTTWVMRLIWFQIFLLDLNFLQSVEKVSKGVRFFRIGSTANADIRAKDRHIPQIFLSDIFPWGVMSFYNHLLLGSQKFCRVWLMVVPELNTFQHGSISPWRATESVIWSHQCKRWDNGMTFNWPKSSINNRAVWKVWSTRNVTVYGRMLPLFDLSLDFSKYDTPWT